MRILFFNWNIQASIANKVKSLTGVICISDTATYHIAYIRKQTIQWNDNNGKNGKEDGRRIHTQISMTYKL